MHIYIEYIGDQRIVVLITKNIIDRIRKYARTEPPVGTIPQMIELITTFTPTNQSIVFK
ncbi:MAG: hypothetical protein ACOVO1_00990 [Chitinophagaceae bacterium]